MSRIIKVLSKPSNKDILNENDNELSEAVRNTLKLEVLKIPYGHYSEFILKVNTILELLYFQAEELFVSPHFKPCVTTVSSTSLAGSYVTLPKFRPYSAHDSELLSVIPEKEHLSIDYTKKASTDGIDATTIEIAGRKYILKENVKKDKATVLFDYHDHSKSEDGAFKSGCSAIDCTEASSGAASKPNKIEICENTIVLNESKATQSIDDNDNSIKDKSCSDEEVQESIENFESENESCFSSIAESLQDDI
ncbi:uncharacterized protein LOC120632907 [Pararge aegeria]|uniref:uncharacterized protein LOC120632907 n=1 Tax=Pararge aegeria TaxID=116150 RepID=UPI0019D1E7EE|nr:uncharacterized protein LOC120632907 [Pararge aegeria]